VQQVIDRRVIGAEIVQPESEAELFEGIQRLLGGLEIVNVRGLGDLDVHFVRVDAARRDQVRQSLDDAAFLELARREIDVEADAGCERLPPGRVRVGLAHQDVIEDEELGAGAFLRGLVNDGRFAQLARLPPLPQQRLGGVDGAGACVVNRLVEEDELILVLQGTVESGLGNFCHRSVCHSSVMRSVSRAATSPGGCP